LRKERPIGVFGRFRENVHFLLLRLKQALLRRAGRDSWKAGNGGKQPVEALFEELSALESNYAMA